MMLDTPTYKGEPSIGPRPKIFLISAAQLFSRLLSVQERTRKSHTVEELAYKSEGNHRACHGDAKFVEESL
jgi:hypothetical protein